VEDVDVEAGLLELDPVGLAVELAEPVEVTVTMPVEVEAGALPEEVVEAAGVLEPMADVGAVIRLCSVALKVPVMPDKVNLAEKPSHG